MTGLMVVSNYLQHCVRAAAAKMGACGWEGQKTSRAWCTKDLESVVLPSDEGSKALSPTGFSGGTDGGDACYVIGRTICF